MRLRATLTSLTAIAAALAVLAPMAPANAVPSVTGEYSTATPTVLTFLKSDECRDVLSVRWTTDLQGIGNAIQAQGYTNYSEKTQPVYTNTGWSRGWTVTGPNNFYYTYDAFAADFPTSEDTETLEVCPSDFGTGSVTPGTYTITTRMYAEVGKVCGAGQTSYDQCPAYENVYTKTTTQTVVLDFSAECYAAKASVTALTPKVVAAKKGLKKAKAAHNKKKILRAKKKLRAAKAKLVKARSDVVGLC